MVASEVVLFVCSWSAGGAAGVYHSYTNTQELSVFLSRRVCVCVCVEQCFLRLASRSLSKILLPAHCTAVSCCTKEAECSLEISEVLHIADSSILKLKGRLRRSSLFLCFDFKT